MHQPIRSRSLFQGQLSSNDSATPSFPPRKAAIKRFMERYNLIINSYYNSYYKYNFLGRLVQTTCLKDDPVIISDDEFLWIYMYAFGNVFWRNFWLTWISRLIKRSVIQRTKDGRLNDSRTILFLVTVLTLHVFLFNYPFIGVITSSSLRLAHWLADCNQLTHVFLSFKSIQRCQRNVIKK